MRRSVSAIALFVSFAAMSVSGIFMLVMDQPSFSIRMHPVHKLFGIVMVVAALSHVGLNARALINHARQRPTAIVGALLTAVLAVAAGASMTTQIPEEAARELDRAARRLEQADGPASVPPRNETGTSCAL